MQIRFSKDLPNLYSPDVSPLIASENEKSPSSTNKFIDLDRSSTELYQSWIIRTPQLFPIYSKENETIGRLPLLMFWFNKTENRFATKCTSRFANSIEMIIDLFLTFSDIAYRNTSYTNA